MEGEGQEGVAVETASPTVSDPNGQPTAQAPSQPAQPAAPPEPPFHQHPRFQQLIQEGRASKQIIGQLQQQIQSYEQKFAELERKQSQGQHSPEEAEELRKAGGALGRIYQTNPELVEQMLSMNPKMKALMDNADRLIAMQGGVTQMQQAQTQQVLRQAQSHIRGLAKEHGIPDDPESLSDLLPMVARRAQNIQGGNDRFAQGDMSVLDEAFNALNASGLLKHMQRASTTRLLESKSRTQSLPPAPRGGAAGPPGLAKFDPKTMTVQDRMNDLRKASAGLLAEGRQE
jgi:hypothetical protein